MSVIDGHPNIVLILQIMPPKLISQGSDRKAAEREIVDLLRNSDHPRRVQEIVSETNFDEAIVLRAVFRLAASGRAVLDENLNISLAAA
jgi:hypothetical protein